MPYAPRVRITKVAGRLQDPFDFLAEMLSPPPLPSDDEIELILAHTPNEQLIIDMDKRPNGEYMPANLLVPKYR
jgi:hypothetical protein